MVYLPRFGGFFWQMETNIPWMVRDMIILLVYSYVIIDTIFVKVNIKSYRVYTWNQVPMDIYIQIWTYYRIQFTLHQYIWITSRYLQKDTLLRKISCASSNWSFLCIFWGTLPLLNHHHVGENSQNARWVNRLKASKAHHCRCHRCTIGIDNSILAENWNRTAGWSTYPYYGIFTYI